MSCVRGFLAFSFFLGPPLKASWCYLAPHVCSVFSFSLLLDMQVSKVKNGKIVENDLFSKYGKVIMTYSFAAVDLFMWIGC